MTSPLRALRLVRLLRSDPPGETQIDPLRRAVYAAACEQFEQLLSASATAGFAARPLTLFYALSQAVHALLAAALPGDEWQPTKHGASQLNGQSVITASIDVKERGAFPLLGRALGVQRLVGPVRLASAWSALPELSDLALDDSLPRALKTQLSELDAFSPMTRVLLTGWPKRLRNVTRAALQSELSRYPTPRGYGQPVVPNDNAPRSWFESLAVD